MPAVGGQTGAGGASASTGGSGGAGPANPVGVAKQVPGTADYNCSAPTGTATALALEEVASGFTDLTYVTHAPGDSRLFALEQRGVISVIEAGSQTVFLDIDSKVVDKAAYDERGLLGLAFHPDYQQNGLFYVHYSADPDGTAYEAGETVIAEYQVSAADPNRAADTERVVFHHTQPFSNHNGGSIAFGSDGMLYIGLGDGGSANDPENNGQRPSTLLGAMLRIDPSKTEQQSHGSYGLVSGNLVDTMPVAAPEIWDYGLRNPFRFNFDACTGDLYIGDVGQDNWEEVDIELTLDGGKNYGWNVAEGKHCRGSDGSLDSCDRSGMTDPVWDYSHADGGVSITGGAVYRGSAIPWLRGTYFYGDYGNASISSFSFARETLAMTSVVNHSNEFTANGVSSIQNGPGGEIYISTLGGSIYRLVSAP